jgi:hypothetical protein
VGERRGRGSRRECARAGPWLGAGKAELTGWSRGAARESGRAGETAQRLAKRAHEEERERSARAKATGADNPPHWAERECAGKETAADRWNPPVK